MKKRQNKLRKEIIFKDKDSSVRFDWKFKTITEALSDELCWTGAEWL